MAAPADVAAIKALAANLESQREQLKLWKRPIATIRLFSQVVLSLVSQSIASIASHPAFVYAVVPVLVALVVSGQIEGPHRAPLGQLVAAGEDVVFWTGLGVLSSVGLGTGMHSGVLFLFPHIAKVCMAASACGSLELNADYSCRAGAGPSGDVTFGALFLAVFWPCFLWGSGTAIGEIPPYAIARAARLAGGASAELDEWGAAPGDTSLHARALDWMKRSMFAALARYGFWAILAFSAWPNMAFDLCGIACGHFLIPFWVFFGATFVGKALIKVNLQAAFFIVLFREDYFEAVADWVDHLTPASLGLEQRVRDAFAAQKARFSGAAPASASDEAGPSLLARGWSAIMILFIGSFVLSVIHSLAQQRQKEADDAAIKAAETAANLRAETPPPSPRKRAAASSPGKPK